MKLSNTLLGDAFGRPAALGLLLAAAVLAFQGCNGSSRTRGATTGAASGAAIGGVAGHQSGEGAEGAAIGAVAGALIGGALADDEDEELGTRPIGSSDQVDYGELMTRAEKERVLERANRTRIDDWAEHLTEDEKRRLVERYESRIGG